MHSLEAILQLAGLSGVLERKLAAVHDHDLPAWSASLGALSLNGLHDL